jgi:hypothetical protein
LIFLLEREVMNRGRGEHDQGQKTHGEKESDGGWT